MAHSMERKAAEDMPWYSKIGAAVRKGVHGGPCQEDWMVNHGDRVHPASIGDAPGTPRQWHCFAFADAMEEGAAVGLPTPLVEAPSPTEAREQRCTVVRNAARTSYKLQNEVGETVLLAKMEADGCRFDIFVGAVADGAENSPLAMLGPSFTLSASSSARTTWTLTSARCERCQLRGSRQCGKRELMRLLHYSEAIGDGQAFCIDVELPHVQEDGSPAVICERCGDARPPAEVALTAKRPRWNPKHRSLTLDFYSRCSMASAKNFQLEDPKAPASRPGKYTLLFGKIAENRFTLDYRHPLGMVQAFAAALSASHWK